MAGEVGSIGFAYDAANVKVLSASIEIFCERTERRYQEWQLKTHAAITQAYLAKVQDYEQKLAQARAAAGTVIAGRNPDFNQRLVASELRLQCLSLLTGQQFDAFGALELSAEGYAQPDLDRTAAQMPYVRFFEQAFEWEHIVYFFYPYFWGWKHGVEEPAVARRRRSAVRRLLARRRGARGIPGAARLRGRSDPLPGDRRRSGTAAPPPDISSSLYVPIVTEIQESTGAPGNEEPVGDPWLVRLPTTLVRLRPHNDCPSGRR